MKFKWLASDIVVTLLMCLFCSIHARALSANEQPSNNSVAKFSLVAWPVKNIISPGDAILLHFSLHNLSSESLKVYYTMPGIDYLIEIRNNQGKIIEQMPDIFETEPGQSVRSTSIHPGDKLEDTYNISAYYHNIKNWEYTINAERSINYRGKTIIIRSNLMHLTVAPNISHELSLTTWLSNEIIAPGSPLYLYTSCHNSSNTSQQIASSGVFDGLIISVENELGQKIAMKNKNSTSITEPTFVRIDSDETKYNKIALKDYFNIKNDGSYFISATQLVKGNDGKIIKLASNVSVLTVTNNIILNPIMFISPDRSTIIRGSDPIIQLSLLNISRQSIDLASFLNPSKVNATKVIPENNDLQPNIKANDPEVGHFGFGGGVEDQKASNAWKKANALEIEIIVRDEQGNEHILREVNNPIEKDIGTLILNAGQFIHYKYYVNEYLNEPGKYFIYVVRKMDEQDDSKNDKKIISNTILLTVVAATAK